MFGRVDYDLPLKTVLSSFSLTTRGANIMVRALRRLLLSCSIVTLILPRTLSLLFCPSSTTYTVNWSPSSNTGHGLMASPSNLPVAKWSSHPICWLCSSFMRFMVVAGPSLSNFARASSPSRMLCSTLSSLKLSTMRGFSWWIIQRRVNWAPLFLVRLLRRLPLPIPIKVERFGRLHLSG